MVIKQKLPNLDVQNYRMKKLLLSATCMMLMPELAFSSESDCKYKTNINLQFQGTITSSKNYDRKVYPYVEDTRKCVVKMDVNINNTWHSISDSYVFGPDVTEDSACKKAEVRAKEKILRSVVPEKLNKVMQQNCKVKTVSPPSPQVVQQSIPPVVQKNMAEKQITKMMTNTKSNNSWYSFFKKYKKRQASNVLIWPHQR